MGLVVGTNFYSSNVFQVILIHKFKLESNCLGQTQTNANQTQFHIVWDQISGLKPKLKSYQKSCLRPCRFRVKTLLLCWKEGTYVDIKHFYPKNV